MTVRVAVRNVSKTFGATTALQGVDLDFAPGEVHALLGSNGSGKSTLVKILAGVESPDPGGALVVDGEERSWRGWDADAARLAGMCFVHQYRCLFPSLSVAENIAADGPMAKGPLAPIRWRRLRRDCRRLLRKYELGIDPGSPLGTLGPADQAMVAIVRALQEVDERGDRALLVLDEPTASLPRHEVDVLLAAVRHLAEEGHAIVYVTHRLDEVFAATDRVTVLRNGSVVATEATADLDEGRLVALITGRAAAEVVAPPPEASSGPLLLSVAGIEGRGLRGVSFELRRGEVLGIAGMVGAGCSELLRVLFGDAPRRAGTVTLEGEEVDFRTPGEAMRHGVAYIPNDRQDSVFVDMTVAENLVSATLRDYWQRGALNGRAQRRDSSELVDRFSVVSSSIDQPLWALSGGNQQKVVLARWLRRQPKLLLLDEPSQGVDVGARAEIYGAVREVVANGAAALVFASDAQELAQFASRIIVLRDGEVVAELKGHELETTTVSESLYRKKERV